MTTPTAAAVADLRALREQWGDLLAAIGRAPAAVWPPRETKAFLDQPATGEPEPESELAAVGRLPLVLRQHPAPANLDALDAAVSIELDLFALADHLAAVVQRPIRHVPIPTAGRIRGGWIEDRGDRDDPSRWHLATSRDLGTGGAASAGSRTYGLHWAAVWIEGRLLDEPALDLFRTVPLRLVDDVRSVVRHARAELERALHRDDVPTVLADPCPWCGGKLIARTNSGDPAAAVVACDTGPGCRAPVLLDKGRRRWRGADLVGLWAALDAARRRTTTG